MQDGHEYCAPGKPACVHCKAKAYDEVAEWSMCGGVRVLCPFCFDEMLENPRHTWMCPTCKSTFLRGRR